jgi:hypothetical protein
VTNKLDYVWAHQLPKKGIAHRSNYPVISNVSVSGTGLVTWTTDIPSTSQVNYGSSPNLGIMSSFDGTLVTSHSMQLPNLSNGSRYYLRVQSFYLDSLSVSDLYSFIFSGGSFLTMEDGTNYILLEDGTKIVLES